MDTNTLIIIIAAIILVGGAIITWIVLATKKKKQDKSIPTPVLLELEEAERRFEQANGRKTQQEILWELAREHFAGRSEQPNLTIERVSNQGRSEQRTNIQSGSIESNTKINSGTERTVRKNHSRPKQFRFEPI